MNPIELTLTRTFKASAQQVFRAWLDPQALARFMIPGSGMSVPKVEVDAQVGGSFLIVMQAGEREMPHSGEYTHIEEFSKLAFTWYSPHAKEGSLVTLSFRETGPETTELTLHHSGFENEELRKNHEGGWGSILDILGQQDLSTSS